MLMLNNHSRRVYRDTTDKPGCTGIIHLELEVRPVHPLLLLRLQQYLMLIPFWPLP
jgi:hypothetical protein